MLSSIRLLQIGVLSLALLACAKAPLYFRLDPELTVVSSGIGQGKSVALQVIDSSKAATLADNQTRYLLETPAQQVLQRKLTDALRSQGFLVVDKAERVLEVRIVKADHIISKGMVTDNIAIEQSLSFTAKTAAGTQTRSFNDARNRDVGGNAKIGELAGDMNQSLGSVLNRALSDSELLPFLAK